MINFVLILALLYGCPLEGQTTFGEPLRRCIEWSLTIDTARTVGPLLTGPDIEWSYETPFQSQILVTSHVGIDDFFYVDLDCWWSDINVINLECVTDKPIRGQTNFRYTTNCTADCMAELSETVAFTHWVFVSLWDIDLDSDGDIDLKDYYYLQQIRVLK